MEEEEFAGQGAEPRRLPRGRHGLPREIVVENQRQRLIAAIIATVASHGYNEITVAQITTAAALSRRTFYEHFSNKEDCFGAAYEVVFGALREAMEAALGAESEWPAQVRAALGAMLQILAEEPDAASFLLIGSLSAGDEIAERHRDSMQQLVGLLLAGAPRRGAGSTAREQTLAGGLSNLIVRKINAGEGAGLRELLPALTELLLRPYLGAEDAVRWAGGGKGADTD